MARKNYGIPYTGSKNFIAKFIVDCLPEADTLVDVFAGGCAVTHAAIESGKFKRFIMNDINPQFPRLFLSAINGEYHNERRWISRDDFGALREADAYVATCWSFGNNCRSYAYSRWIEPWKKALHYARVLGDFSLMEEFGIHTDCTREDIQRNYEEYTEKYSAWCYSKGLVKEEHGSTGGLPPRPWELQSLDGLQRLESLERLQGLERAKVCGESFERLEIPRGAVVYCDPPYANTTKRLYMGQAKVFNRERFLDWCVDVSRTNPVFISEYLIEDSRFEVIAEREKRCSLDSSSNPLRHERLYTVKR